MSEILFLYDERDRKENTRKDKELGEEQFLMRGINYFAARVIVVH